MSMGNDYDDYQEEPTQNVEAPSGQPQDVRPPTDLDDSQLTGMQAPAQQEPTKEDPVTLDSYTKSMAQQMGLDMDGDPAEIQKQVDNADRMRLQQFMQTGGMQQPNMMPTQPNQWLGGPNFQNFQQPPQQFQQNFQQQQQPPQQQQFSPGQQQQQTPQAPEKLDFGDLSGWDDEAQKTFGTIQQHFNQQREFFEQQLDGMRQMFQGFVQTQSERQVASTTAWIDKQLSDLGDDVFGNGPINQLGPYSQAAMARQRIVSEYVAFCDMNGIDPYSCNADAFSRVVSLSGVSSEPARKQKQLSDRLKQRSKKTIGRPATRRGKSAAEREVHPEAGIPNGDVNDLQDMIDGMMESNV